MHTNSCKAVLQYGVKHVSNTYTLLYASLHIQKGAYTMVCAFAVAIRLLFYSTAAGIPCCSFQCTTVIIEYRCAGSTRISPMRSSRLIALRNLPSVIFSRMPYQSLLLFPFHFCCARLLTLLLPISFLFSSTVFSIPSYTDSVNCFTHCIKLYAHNKTHTPA